MTLPETTSVVARPAWARFLRRQSGEHVGPPTEDEQRDAIRILEEEHAGTRPPFRLDDLVIEAERILDESL